MKPLTATARNNQKRRPHLCHEICTLGALLLLLAGCGLVRPGQATAVPDWPDEPPTPAGPAEEFEVIDPLEQATEIASVQEHTASREATGSAYLHQYGVWKDEGDSPAWVQGEQMDTGVIRTELLRLINEDRQQQSLESLGLEEDVDAAAQIRAGEIIADLTHTRPDGTPYYTAFDEVGFSYSGKWHGENVCRVLLPAGTGSEELVALQVFQNLRSTPGHSYNLRRESFLQVGIGIEIEYDSDFVRVGCVQLFAGL